MSLHVFAEISPKPEHYTDALSAILNIVDRTRAEAGCHQFEICVTQDDSAICLIEHWESQSALDAHYQMDYTQAVFQAYEQWLAQPPDIKKLKPAKAA